MPETVNPTYRDVARAIVGKPEPRSSRAVPYDAATGSVDREALAQFAGEDITALVDPAAEFLRRSSRTSTR